MTKIVLLCYDVLTAAQRDVCRAHLSSTMLLNGFAKTKA